MVDVSILKNFKISFGLSKKLPTILEINPVADDDIGPLDDAEESKRVSNELQTAIRNSKIEGPIRLTFVLEDSKCKVQGNGPFLDYLLTTMGTGIEFWISSHSFTCSILRNRSVGRFSGNEPIYFPGNFSEWHPLGCKSDSKFLDFFSFPNTQVGENDVIACTTEFSISVTGSATGLPVTGKDFAGNFNKWILLAQYQTDMEIYADNGAKIGCHKIFLAGNSPVFEKMLDNQSFIEGQTHSIVLEDMSELGVRALLGYLYCGLVEPAVQDFNICLELLEASEKYGIERLQESMKFILLNKPVRGEWFTVDGTLRLFGFTRNLKNCVEIKQLAVRVVKLKYAELHKSELYKQVFKEDSEAAMDLCASIAALRLE